MPSGQPVTFGPTRSEPLPPWGAAGSSRLPTGQPPAAAPGPRAGGCADAPQLGRPLPCDRGALPGSLSASGLSAVPHTSFERHCTSQFLHLAPPSSRAHPVHDLDNPSPFGGPTREQQMLRVRASSCSDLPPVGPPAVGSVGGTCPSRQLLRSQSGSYPQKARHVPAHVNNHAATSATDILFLLPPADPDDLEHMDFYNFWRGLA
ncbi:hypothetical protein COCOBI_19-1370 [Coccomyxa sp. Obi]|nr:hypothetical protein COCOBI_19-1370 [Coccomyxa sp. Obi]